MKVQRFGNFQSINDLRSLHRQLIHCCGVSTQYYKINVLILKTICITNTFRIRQRFVEIENITRKLRLHINPIKTKYMIVERKNSQNKINYN